MGFSVQEQEHNGRIKTVKTNYCQKFYFSKAQEERNFLKPQEERDFWIAQEEIRQDN